MSTPPIADLDAACSRHFAWRDLLQCGETWQRLASARPADFNLPRQHATWTDLQHLAQAILDPLTDHFGPLVLTYCFAGPRLTQQIERRIAPRLDQHAGSEVGRGGSPICARLGQACDLFASGTPTDIVANYIIDNLPFDRLYYYGADRPVHVSVGPENARATFDLRAAPSGRLIPRRMHRPPHSSH